MKAHCPACGRTTRVAEDVLDFPVRCERCRIMLLARSPAAGVVGVKTEVLPLGRIHPPPGRFHAAPRTDFVELLTHRPRPTLTAAARSAFRNSHCARGHGFAGLCMAMVTAIMLTAVLGAGFWKLHAAVRPASAATSNASNITRNSDSPPMRRASPTAPISDSSPADSKDDPSPAPQTATGNGELFPNVPADK